MLFGHNKKLTNTNLKILTELKFCLDVKKKGWLIIFPVKTISYTICIISFSMLLLVVLLYAEEKLQLMRVCVFVVSD